MSDSMSKLHQLAAKAIADFGDTVRAIAVQALPKLERLTADFDKARLSGGRSSFSASSAYGRLDGKVRVHRLATDSGARYATLTIEFANAQQVELVAEHAAEFLGAMTLALNGFRIESINLVPEEPTYYINFHIRF